MNDLPFRDTKGVAFGEKLVFSIMKLIKLTEFKNTQRDIYLLILMEMQMILPFTP